MDIKIYDFKTSLTPLWWTNLMYKYCQLWKVFKRFLHDGTCHNFMHAMIRDGQIHSRSCQQSSPPRAWEHPHFMVLNIFLRFWQTYIDKVHIMQLDHIRFVKSPFYFWLIIHFSVFPAQFWIFSKLLMQFEWRPLRLLTELKSSKVGFC